MWTWMLCVAPTVPRLSLVYQDLKFKRSWDSSYFALVHLAYLVKEMAYLRSLFHPSWSAKYKISSFQKANVLNRKSKPEHWQGWNFSFQVKFLEVSVSSLSLPIWPWAGHSVWLAVSLITMTLVTLDLLSLLGLLLNSSQQLARVWHCQFWNWRNNDRLWDRINENMIEISFIVAAQGQLATSEMELHGCISYQKSICSTNDDLLKSMRKVAHFRKSSESKNQVGFSSIGGINRRLKASIRQILIAQERPCPELRTWPGVGVDPTGGRRSGAKAAVW